MLKSIIESFPHGEEIREYSWFTHRKSDIESKSVKSFGTQNPIHDYPFTIEIPRS